MFRLGVSIILLFLIVGASHAKMLYVDASSGNDSVSYADNSENNPWATIGRAAWGNSNRNNPDPNEAARAGDTVYVAAGTYSTDQGTGLRYEPIYNPVNNGEANNVITFLANGLVTLESNTPGVGNEEVGEPIIGTLNRHHIIWDGFYIDEANVNTKRDTGPVVVWGSNNITIQNLQIRMSHAWQDNHNAIRLEYAESSTIKNNKIWNSYGANNPYNASGVLMYHSNYIVVEHNEIFDSGGGIFVKGVNEGPVTIRYNLLYNVDRGITLGGIGTAVAQRGAKVYQNVIRDSGECVVFIGYDNYSPANVTVSNNTIDNCNRAIFLKPGTGGYRNIVFVNNIISNSSFAINGESISDISNVAFEHNHYFNNSTLAQIGSATYSLASWKSQAGQDTQDPVAVEQNPNYVDLSSNNMRLQDMSSSIGIDFADIDNDNNTTELITRGAYVNGLEVIGRPQASPSPPTGLRATP